MQQTIRWARSHLRRYLAMAFNYVSERAVLLSAILVPAILGTSDAELGRLELLLTAAALAAAIGPLGTQHALMYTQFRGIRSAWRLSVATGVLGGLAVGALASLTLGADYALLGGALGMFIAIHRVSSYRLRTDDQIAPLTWSSFIFLAAFAIGALLVGGGDPVATTILPVLMAAALLASIPAFLRARVDSGDHHARYSEMLRYGLPLSLAALADWVVVAGDRYIIQLFLGLDAVGPYGVVYRSAMLLSGAVSTLVIWWQAEAMRRGFDWASAQLRRFLTLAVGATLLLSVIGIGPVTVLLDSVTTIGSGTILAVTAWLFVSIAGFVALMTLVHVFASAGWVGEVGLLSIGNALLNVAGNFALIPVFGLPGAAAATAISQCATATAAAILYRRRLRFDLE